MHYIYAILGGRDLYRAKPAMTRNIGLQVLIRRTVACSRLHGPIVIRNLSGLHVHIWYTVDFVCIVS